MSVTDASDGLQDLRTAIVHDWLSSYGGAEKVIEQILRLFPRADIFTLVDHLPPGDRDFLNGRPVRTSFMQNMPGSRRIFRKLLWMLPLAIETFDLSEYDLVISSSHAVAKGVITSPHQLHICYCHTPIRYAWDLQHQYLRQSHLDHGLKSVYAQCVLHYLRMWDARTANGVDCFVTNSEFVARRVFKAYRRGSAVIHPPVDVDCFQLEREKEEFYLTASRLVPYKRVDAIVAGFAQMPDRKLIVVGDGPGLGECRRLARSNITFLPYLPAAEMRSLMARAKAFVFAAEEDFGITVVEAQACGTPVICYGRGGVLDSVIANRTGIFFREQTAASIAAAVELFESGSVPLLSPDAIRSHALGFSREEFLRKFGSEVLAQWTSARERRPLAEGIGVLKGRNERNSRVA